MRIKNVTSLNDDVVHAIVVAQQLLDSVAAICDPKHKYYLKMDRKRVEAFIGDTLYDGKRRRIGVTKAFLKRPTNAIIRVLIHELAHFVYTMRFRNKPYDAMHKRSHNKSYRKVEASLVAKVQSAYGEKLPVHCWDN